MGTKLTLFFILLFFPVIANAKDVLQLGYLEYPPMIYSEEEHIPKGPIIDFLEQNLDEHFEIKWSKIPIGRVRWAFKNRVIDAYPFLIRTKEREEWVHYFAKPYTSIQNVICSKTGTVKPAGAIITPVDDLAGSSLVYPLNASYKYPFLSDTRITLIKIEYTNYIMRSLSLLDMGRADYIFFPARGSLERAGKLHELSCKNVGKELGLYFAVAKNNKLAPRLEKIFETLEPFD